GPLDRKEILLRRIAGATRGDEIRSDRAAAAHERDAVVHREFAGRGRAPAIAAPLAAQPALPPRAHAELAGARLLTAQLGARDRAHEAACGQGQRVRIRTKRSDGW